MSIPYARDGVNRHHDRRAPERVLQRVASVVGRSGDDGCRNREGAVTRVAAEVVAPGSGRRRNGRRRRADWSRLPGNWLRAPVHDVSATVHTGLLDWIGTVTEVGQLARFVADLTGKRRNAPPLSHLRRDTSPAVCAVDTYQPSGWS
jgi:hypothetical protein